MQKLEGTELLALLQKGGHWTPCSRGHHLEVSRVRFGGTSFIVKEFTRSDAPSDHEGVSRLAADVITYAEKLNEARVPTPVPKIAIMAHQDESWRLTTIDPDAGEDLKNILLSAPSSANAKEVVLGMLRILKNLFDHPVFPDSTELRVGLDPKPDNFGFDGEVTRYIDLMPPRFRKDDRPILEIPAPRTKLGRRMSYFRCYDMRGLIVLTLTQVCRVRPEFRDCFVELVSAFANQSSPQVSRFFDEFSGTQFRLSSSPTERKVIVSALRSDDVYGMRDIACQLVFERSEYGKNELEVVFRASHFEDALSLKQTEGVKSLLLSLM